MKHGLPKSVRALWGEFNGQFGYFPWASIAYCLDAAGLSIDELDAIVLPEGGEGASLIPIKDRRKILVCDEPAGAEHHWRHALSAFFASPFERAAVLVIDHDMRVVMGVSSKVIVMDFGRKIAEGTPDEVRADPVVVTAYLGGSADGAAEGR